MLSFQAPNHEKIISEDVGMTELCELDLPLTTQCWPFEVAQWVRWPLLNPISGLMSFSVRSNTQA